MSETGTEGHAALTGKLETSGHGVFWETSHMSLGPKDTCVTAVNKWHKTSGIVTCSEVSYSDASVYLPK